MKERIQTLPDLFICRDGSKITSKEEWEQRRRPEIIELFRSYVYAGNRSVVQNYYGLMFKLEMR